MPDQTIGEREQEKAFGQMTQDWFLKTGEPPKRRRLIEERAMHFAFDAGRPVWVFLCGEATEFCHSEPEAKATPMTATLEQTRPVGESGAYAVFEHPGRQQAFTLWRLGTPYRKRYVVRFHEELGLALAEMRKRAQTWG